MNRRRVLLLRAVLPVVLVLGLFFTFASAARTQEPDEPLNYDNNTPNDSAGPVRLARFSYVQGDVSWRPDEQDQWSGAETNLPLRQGSDIWTTAGGRAELQFDDGSELRLGARAFASLRTLYSDSDGEFTQLTLKDGPANLRLQHDHSVYQVDTPFASVSARGPARIRLTVDDHVRIAVLSGRATVEGRNDKVTLESGQYLALRDENSRFEPRSFPGPDNFDRWCSDRDHYIAASYSRPSHRRLPRNISLVANNLDDYGSWYDDPEYGDVWCPRVTSADWRPYRSGHWVWVNPFGWTWVSDEPWGWAPYHYGTWCHTGRGWGWAPGPAYQYWCPAVVNFCEYDGRVGWAPLCPSEVRYPSYFSIGFGGRDWSLFFSIGQAAVYYPTYSRWCEPRPFNTVYCNRVVNVYNHSTYVNNYYNNTVVNRNTYLSGSGGAFLPRNARYGGAVFANSGTFGRRGKFQAASGDASTFFRRGRVIGAPERGYSPVAGPRSIRPTAASFASSHSFRRGAGPSQSVDSRPVFSAPVNPRIARGSRPILPSGAPAPYHQRDAVRTSSPRGARDVRGSSGPGAMQGTGHRGQSAIGGAPAGRQPDRPRTSYGAPNRMEGMGRPSAGGLSRFDRADAFSSGRLRGPGPNADLRQTRERSSGREAAMEAAMHARHNLGLPTHERTVSQPQVSSRQPDSRWSPGVGQNVERPRRTVPGYESSVRSRTPELPRRTAPSTRQEPPLTRNEDRRRAPDIGNSRYDRPNNRTLPGNQESPRARTFEAPRRVDPPARQESPFSRNDSPRRAPEVRSYPSERPSYRPPDQGAERARRPAESYSPPVRREPQYRQEPRSFPEPRAESRSRREPVYQPEVRRQPETYSPPPRREMPSYCPEVQRRPEPPRESFQREAPQIRREMSRPMEMPRREAAPAYRPQERAPAPAPRAREPEQPRGRNSSVRAAETPDGRDRRPHR